MNNLTHFHIHHHISVINFLIYFDTRCKSVTLFYFDISLRTYAASSPVSASIRHSFALPFRAKKTHVMFVSKETRRVMTSQIQAIANYNNVQKTCQLSDIRLATAMSEHRRADRKLSNDLDQTAIQVRDKYDVWCKLIYSTSMTNVSSFIYVVSGN